MINTTNRYNANHITLMMEAKIVSKYLATNSTFTWLNTEEDFAA
jgi:hypothetical protein